MPVEVLRQHHVYDAVALLFNAHHFTGKERDSESGLDYFGARYFSGAQGRFTSPDPKMFPHDITDPQSWNKYGYTRNNPLRFTDPNGEDFWDYLVGAANAFGSDNALGAGRATSGNSDFKTGQAIGDAVATLTGTARSPRRRRRSSCNLASCPDRCWNRCSGGRRRCRCPWSHNSSDCWWQPCQRGIREHQRAEASGTRSRYAPE